MRKIKNKTKLYLVIIFILFGSIGLVYANPWNIETLKINSEVALIGSEWNIRIKNVSKLENVKNIDIVKTSNDLTKTKMDFTLELVSVGDVYTIEFDVLNNGKKNGEIEFVNIYSKDEIIKSITSEGVVEGTYKEEKYLKADIKYWDDVDISIGDLLKQQEEDKMKLILSYVQDDEVNYDQLDKEKSLSVEVVYKEANETSKKRKVSLGKNAKIGEYLQLNIFDTEDIITIAKEESGLDENQEIRLNDLSLWRIIDLDEENNKVELVSKYTSHDKIKLKGELGFKNSVNIFKNISNSVLEKNENILESRVFGYNNQKLVLDSLNDESNTDSLYESDYEKNNLVDNNIISSEKNGGLTSYYISSRLTEEDKNYIRVVNQSGEVSKMLINDVENESETENGIRLIIAIDYNTLVKNEGVENDPYKVE